MNSILTRQTKTGKWLGMYISMYQGSSVYQSIFNSLLIAITAYNTSLRSTIVSMFPWMNFWFFLLFAFIGQHLVMWIHWKFVQPSIIAWNNDQSWEHNNPVKTYLDDPNKGMVTRDEFRKAIAELKGKK